MEYTEERTDEIPRAGEPPRGFIVELTRDLRELVRLEVELAKTEVKGALADARTGAILLGSASMVGALGLAMLPIAAALALGIALPLWAGFLIVGGALLLIAGAFGLAGVKKLKEVDPVPHRAISALQEFGSDGITLARRADGSV